jgi:DNA-binding FadR family transcriptional regulator
MNISVQPDLAVPARAEEGAPTRVQHAIDAMIDYIRRSNLRVGDDLPSELQFAKDLGVSRSVIREAIGALAALKLIDVGNGRRPRVSALNVSVMSLSLHHALGTRQISVQEVWDFRRGLELHSVALAAARRTDEEAFRIMMLARQMSKQRDDLPKLVETDVAFHQAIANASHNILVAQVVTSFTPLMQDAIPRAWRTRTTDEGVELIVQKHLAVAEAIAEGDPDAAVRAMGDHFDRSVEAMLAAEEAGVTSP